MKGSLNTFYKAIGISKQAVHQRLDREIKRNSYEHQLLFLIDQVREDHPTMGCRDMYYFIKPEFIGRDRFELFCKFHGYASKKIRNYRVTTDSSGVKRFSNLTETIDLNDINQLWVSDITYFELNGKFYYITFIMDAFSRRILGYNVSRKLFTEKTTLPALTMAIGNRKDMSLEGLIFHSDGGGQYYDNTFLKLTQSLKIKNSMCEYPWDNGKAERINGVIKNNYLIHWDIGTFAELKQGVDRAVNLYNREKPHISLKRLSPLNFEKLYISTGKTSDGEKSTTEYETQTRRADISPAGLGKHPQDQISLKNEKNECLIV